MWTLSFEVSLVQLNTLISNLLVFLKMLCSCTDSCLVPRVLPHWLCQSHLICFGALPSKLGYFNACSRQSGLPCLRLQISSGILYRSHRGVTWNSTDPVVREMKASLLCPGWTSSSPSEAQNKPSPLCHLMITLLWLLRTLDLTNSLFHTNSVPKKYSMIFPCANFSALK